MIKKIITFFVDRHLLTNLIFLSVILVGIFSWQNIKKEEFELMELFEEQKQKALEIKKEIDKIDREIDQMVYQLHDLTDEEIRIIEEAIK